MRLSLTRAVKDAMSKHFNEMLASGAFPKIQYSKTGMFESYSLNEYSLAWARYAKLVDREIKHDMVDNFGIFSRKRSEKFLSYVESICKHITPEQVDNATERFGTWMD